eukprot:5993980-Heterocapsa_arctica.AAC.1
MDKANSRDPLEQDSRGGTSARRTTVHVNPAIPANKICGNVPCAAGMGIGRGRTPIVLALSGCTGGSLPHDKTLPRLPEYGFLRVRFGAMYWDPAGRGYA